ncbi:zinc finger BED domain-containing protein RICESLEEPER 2-like protein [Tanacetum coccineum]
MCLDCRTKWIRTFGMLFTSGNYEEAFKLFEIKDPTYKHYLEETCGVPNHDDWENARKVSCILGEFYHLTRGMFGLDATCDKYILRLSLFDYQFCDWAKGADTKTNTMVLKMREKYSKYWENMDESNMLIFVASVLDPSSKTANIRTYYKRIYNQEDICHSDEDEVEDDESDDSLWKTIVRSVLDIVSDLFYEYKDNIGTLQQSENFQECLKKRKLDDEGNVPTETELDRYLNEATVKYDDDFDILLWWKNNTETFPVLSKIAKDVLAIPLSAVGSESAFKAKFGKLVDDFRSSLSPSIVEALVCAEDWRDKSQK